MNKNLFTDVSNKDQELENNFCGSHWYLSAATCIFCATYATDFLLLVFSIIFWSPINQSSEVLRMTFFPKGNEKAFLIEWEGFMVSSISNPDDKSIANLGSKTTTDNRTAIMVISASGLYLILLLGINCNFMFDDWLQLSHRLSIIIDLWWALKIWWDF